jgi:hypothetical protein
VYEKLELRIQDPTEEEEWKIQRKHPVYAHEMLSLIPYLQPVLAISYGHHEKWVGTGYFQGLKGKQKPWLYVYSLLLMSGMPFPQIVRNGMHGRRKRPEL